MHYIIYQAPDSKIDSSYNPLPESGSKVSSLVSNLFAKMARISLVVGVILLVFFYTPSVWNWVRGATSKDLSSNFQLTSGEVSNLASDNLKPASNYEPPFDSSLPSQNHLDIPSIGVDTDLQEATYDNYEEALKKGVWRVSDFGAPGESYKPIILAAHRFGYLAWTNIYRRKNSFYNLSKLKAGDRIEISYQQRKYVYEVYATGKGPEITDYSANLILYTCEALNGPERIFVYAHLLEI